MDIEYFNSLLELDEGEKAAYELFLQWDRENRMSQPKNEAPNTRPQGMTVTLPPVLDERTVFPEGRNVALTRHPVKWP